jgi:hypothetical protein
MIPPLPASLGDTEHDRFKRFATAILAVPKDEVPIEQKAASRLIIEKKKIESSPLTVQQELANRKSKPKPHRS